MKIQYTVEDMTQALRACKGKPESCPNNCPARVCADCVGTLGKWAADIIDSLVAANEDQARKLRFAQESMRRMGARK